MHEGRIGRRVGFGMEWRVPRAGVEMSVHLCVLKDNGRKAASFSPSHRGVSSGAGTGTRRVENNGVVEVGGGFIKEGNPGGGIVGCGNGRQQRSKEGETERWTGPGVQEYGGVYV